MNVCFTGIVYEADPEHPKTRKMLESAVAVGFTHFVIAVDQKNAPGTGQHITDILLGAGAQYADVFPFKMEDDEGVEDFAAARNLTLPRIPADCPWWGWADADDVIESHKGETVQSVIESFPSDVPVGYFQYNYARDNFGNQTTAHIKGRLYRTDFGWEWKNRVHEDCHPTNGRIIGRDVMYYRDDRNEKGEETDQTLVWVHNTDGRGSASNRNLRILRKMLEEDPHNPRVWYYLGNQHFNDRSWLLATEAFERYIDASGWPLEKWYALIYQSIAYRSLQMYGQSIESDTKALLLEPTLADSYLGLAHTFTLMGEWEKGKHFGEEGMRLVGLGGVPDSTVFFNANAYKFSPYMNLAVCYFNLADFDSALRAYEQAARTRPDEELKRKIEHLKWSMSRQRIINNGIDLAAGLVRRNEPLKARTILQNLPAGTRDNLNVQTALAVVNQRVAHLYDRTKYQNFYFQQEEKNDPLAIGDEDIKHDLPRMDWALQRLKAAGAKRVLDVGIGNAVQDFYLARHGITVVGIDVDRRRVKQANFNAVKAGFQGTKTIEFDEDEVDENVPAKMELPDPSYDSPAQFLYCPPGELTRQVSDLGPFDAVLACELIEHVEDTEEMLKFLEGCAPLVLITTPDGAYDGPQEVNVGHVKAWSQRELSRLLVGRGRIAEIHKVYHDPNLQTNLVAEYTPGEYGQPVEGTWTIFCPNTGQNWSPDSLKTGIGGSETAVIRVAEELVKRNQTVTVYAECEGVWNGVRYAYSEEFRPQRVNNFVSWRTVANLREMEKLADNRYLWVHDVNFGAATEEQLAGVTVLALSEFHKNNLKTLYPTADIVVTGNGIDPERFDREVKRVPHRLIFASSPDRGLERVLRLFPKVREVYPDAELAVFYGFDMARQANPQFIAQVEQLAKQPGVTLGGRIGQDRLAEEYSKADALIYPASMPSGQPFDETFYIGGLEAAAAGCFRVISDHGALREHYLAAHCRLATFDHEALFQLFEFWRRPLKEQNDIRRKAREWALMMTWGRVAEHWISLAQPAEVEEAITSIAR